MKWYLFGGIVAFGLGMVALIRSNDALGLFYGITFVLSGAASITIFFMDNQTSCVDKSVREKP